MINFDNNFTVNNSTTGNVTLIAGNTLNIIFTSSVIIPDKNWMPYRHFEYEPKWHQKFARYKLQIKNMWD